ncbi:DUF1385 domain-containing protein [Meiothermus ruber]|jgi:uncharacterized protein YqhQ|uniref:DUF1385 domain-containing protein n=2 Tax=Meiothermus ruber (strain ATCC 35948 / DSM 1279 / VKM B-1258 / 21) TaxID=504728 RepID=A0A806DJD4_MEIRD|nr:DUF1385 domain-containing protein [Meiothermus ruber]ADD28024.1 protein of unknown function DUF1385 [Meiothermus ruber DSM 1279]MCL6531340.1 DUF1385 domain-containing protein [Meiothermus ruber]GAO74970.1 putative uncharacterized protein [Meiothermus ruber H328]
MDLIGGMALPTGVVLVSEERTAVGYHENGKLRLHTRTIEAGNRGRVRRLALLLLEGLRGLSHVYSGTPDSRQDFIYTMITIVVGAITGTAIRALGLATLQVALLANLLLVVGCVLAYYYYEPFRRFVLEFRRYHGAEHKVVQVLLAGRPLEDAKDPSVPITTVHCGTNLFALVLPFGVLFFFTPIWLAILLGLVLPFALLPLWGWMLDHPQHPVARAFLGLGLWFQRFTVAEPEERYLEAAILAARALKCETVQPSD